MNSLPLSDIVVSPTRQRREFNTARLQELITSIEENGLLQAIVIRKEGSSHVLVAGERRIRALRDIYSLGGSVKHDGTEVPEGEIPFTLLEALDPLSRELAELDENLRRDNLTFLEEAEAVARIAELRGERALSLGEAPPTTKQLAEELFEPARDGFEGKTAHGQEVIRRQLIVARHTANPVVREAKTLDEAYKALKRQEGQKRDAALAERVGVTFTKAAHSCHAADALEWLRSAPTDSFDCILTDPPYGIGADEFGDGGGKAVSLHSYTDDEAYFNRLLIVLPMHFFRVAKPMSHLYWFCDIDWFPAVRAALTQAGWWTHRTPLIWSKPLANGIPWPEHGPRRTYELIAYAVKGKRPTLRPSFPDLITINSDPNLGHSAQKPVALFQELLARTCRAGDTVLDPFCGTGPIFPAAHALKVAATGIELDPAARGIALGRLEKLS